MPRFSKRRCLLLALVVLLSSFSVWMLKLPDERITEANFDQIQDGMTRQQLENLLGKASESYRLGPNSDFSWFEGDGLESMLPGAYYIRVDYENGAVVDKEITKKTGALAWAGICGRVKSAIGR